MSKRRQVRRLMSKSVSVFPSARKSLDERVYTESPLESDLCYHLEFDDKVLAYRAQPTSIKYWFEGKEHRYTADFEVFFANGSRSLIEVKYETDLIRIKNFDEWKEALVQACIKKDIHFQILTDQFIRQKPIYENLQQLYHAARGTSDVIKNPDFLLDIHHKFKSKSVIKISDLIEGDMYDSKYLQVLSLIFNKKLIVDLNSEFISKSSIVKLGESFYER